MDIGTRNDIRSIMERYSIEEIASCPLGVLGHEETTNRIQELLPATKTILVLLKVIPDAIVNRAPHADYQLATTRTFQSLNEAARDISEALVRHGFQASWPGPQKTPHQKKIAEKAGLGSTGKSSLLVSFNHGVDVQLESVLTDCVASYKGVKDKPFACGGCHACIEACPAHAIGPDRRVSREACIAYRRTIDPTSERPLYCGLCMKACRQRNNFETPVTASSPPVLLVT
jgi:epoxyqueuosine reductase QueG